MPNDFITTRTPGSRTSTYGLADHIADTNANPHPQYLLKDDYITDGAVTDGKLEAHIKDPNAHSGVLATIQMLNDYVLTEEFSTILSSHLYHDYAADSSKAHAASMSAVNGAYAAAMTAVNDAYNAALTALAEHTKDYDQNAAVTGHRDSENQELYAHRVHSHDINKLEGTADFIKELESMFSPIGHDHDNRYALITHYHPNYLTQSDLESVGIYPNTTIGIAGTDTETGAVTDPFDFNDETQQGNVSISPTVMSSALNKPDITTPSTASFLNITTEITSADKKDDNGNTIYGERYVSQSLTTDNGIYYRIGHRAAGSLAEGKDESALWTWSDWQPVGGGSKDIFEVFYSTSTATPRGAFPLWTGEWIENCKTKYPSFWSKALELRDAETGAFAYADTDPVAIPKYNALVDGNVLTNDHGSWTAEVSDGSSKWMIFGDVAVGGNVDLPKLSTTQFWASLTTSGDPIAVMAYEIQSTSNREKDPLTTPTAWKLEGSNDGSSWDTLDTQQDVVWSKMAERKLFTVGVRTPTPATYKTLRITFTECTAKPNSNSTMGRVNFVVEKVSRPGRKIGSINVMDEDTYEYYLKKYGEVGGFVIDEDNGRIRLPLINRFLRTIEDINDLGTVQLDELRRHAHSSIIGYMYVRPDTAASGGGCHWHDNNGELTGNTGGLETRPKNIALALYIQVYNSITATAITDLDARVGVLERNAIMFARHDFTASQWNDNKDGTFSYTFNTNHFTSSHIYMNETGGSVLVDESVEVHIVGITDASDANRQVKLVAPQAFTGYIITLG